MIRLLLIFLLLFASIWLGIHLNQDPGYVLITFNHWSIESTVFVAFVALLIFFLLLHTLLFLLQKLIRSPKTFHQWKTKRRIQKAHAKTQKGLIEFSEGHWSQAKADLIKALPDTDSPLLNYLTAARAAQELGDNTLRDTFLREAQQSMPNAKIAVELTQAQLQLANQQWEQALATLKHLQSLAPKHPYVLKLLLHLYQEIKDWQQLILLLPELKKYQIVKPAEYNRLEKETYKQAMIELARQEQIQSLKTLVANLPKVLRDDPDLMALYCEYLIENREDDLAESILRAGLKKQYSDSLIHLYGLVHSHEKQLLFAESLLKKYSQSAALNLCLGRLSAYNHLWGKAKHYFEKSIQLNPQPEAYKELGYLLEQLNDQTGACAAYREGLVLDK